MLQKKNSDPTGQCVFDGHVAICHLSRKQYRRVLLKVLYGDQSLNKTMHRKHKAERHTRGGRSVYVPRLHGCLNGEYFRGI